MHLAGRRVSPRAVNNSHQALNSSPMDKMAANLADFIFNRIFLKENVYNLQAHK